MAKPELKAEYVCSLLDYDPETGVLTWKERPPNHFKTVGAWKIWQKRRVGRRAGGINADGYREVGIHGKIYKAHRIIWLMVHGTWPEQIDHECGDKDNNSIDTLRDVSHAENQRNAPVRKDNRSGTAGVHFDKASRKWQATIRAEGRKMSLGYYDSIEAAAAARKAAERKYGFHLNHGRRPV